MNEIKLSDVRKLPAERYAGIYMIKNIVNGKAYIGQSINIYKRLKEHLYLAFRNDEKRHNYYLYRDIRKHGADSFICKVIELINIKDDKKLTKALKKAEIKYIKRYKTYVKDNPEKGYNLTVDGSTRKYKFSLKQKKNLLKEYKSGITLYELSIKYEISEKTISDAINSICDISSKNNKERDANISNLYLKGMSIKEIEKETGYSHSIVQKSLIRSNTRLRNNKRAASTHECRKINCQLLKEIENDYLNGSSLRDIAKKYQIKRETISMNLKNKGYSIKNTGNKRNKRAVLEIDAFSGETIAEYESISQACKTKKLKSSSSVTDVASKKYDKNKTAGGSKWEYVNAENPYVFSNYSLNILK